MDKEEIIVFLKKYYKKNTIAIVFSIVLFLSLYLLLILDIIYTDYLKLQMRIFIFVFVPILIIMIPLCFYLRYNNHARTYAFSRYLHKQLLNDEIEESEMDYDCPYSINSKLFIYNIKGDKVEILYSCKKGVLKIEMSMYLQNKKNIDIKSIKDFYVCKAGKNLYFKKVLDNRKFNNLEPINDLVWDCYYMAKGYTIKENEHER